jgi:hypothetical protein
MVESYKQRPTTTPEPTVEDAMVAFNTCLNDSACVGSDTMRNLALGLADTCRVSLGSSWGFQAEQFSGDKYQKLIKEYLARSR